MDVRTETTDRIHKRSSLPWWEDMPSLGVSDFHFYNFPDLTGNLLAGFNLANTGAF